MQRIRNLATQSLRLRTRASRRFSFLNGGNSRYVEQMYVSWLQDRASVHVSWQAYFEDLSVSGDPESGFISPQQARSSGKGVDMSAVKTRSAGSLLVGRVEKMANQFRRFGHRKADLDPLNLKESVGKESAGELGLGHESFFSREELSTIIDLSGSTDVLLRSIGSASPGEVAERLSQTYCGTLGFEFEHIEDEASRAWCQAKAETFPDFQISKSEHAVILDELLESQAFSHFCDTKFSTLKRFGADGIDSAVTAMGELVRSFHKEGGNRFVIGMAHRARLNILTTVLKKPYEKMFSDFLEILPEFRKETVPDFYSDVKYHKGHSNLQTDPETGNEMLVEMLCNPSHLEAVNLVVAGYCYGKAREHSSSANNSDSTEISRKKVLPVIIHGDAAMSGQGIVYEGLQMESLDGYSVGGSVHVVFNNQVGFTTNPKHSRSFRSVADIGKANGNLIIKVNGDDVRSVIFAMRAAVEYRCVFGKDVFVDLIGYRKYGHNEQDNPKFTQPVMYKQIGQMRPVYQKYSDSLVAQNLFTQDEIDTRFDFFKKDVIEAEFERVKKSDFNPEVWKIQKNHFNEIEPTGVPEEAIKNVGRKIFDLEGVTMNVDNTIKRLYKNALKTIEEGKAIDWGTAELLAYGTLISEGHALRLSGEDVERGTFSHRQAVLVDQKTSEKMFPLSRVAPQNPANPSDSQTALQRDQMTIINSLLSEYGVLAFEYGHSLSRPGSMSIWEAQFGDFANGAQIVIDQFVMSAEKKWRNFSNLTMLLPHGHDGMGPEHSNARLERYLTNVDDDYVRIESDPVYRAGINEICNARVCNITSPANYFHALRSQLKHPLRKPLIVFTPKRLLRAKDVKSDIADFSPETGFKPVLGDENPNLDKSKVEKVLICSGQIYFDLKAKRASLGLQDRVAILRLERIGPFPYDEFKQEITGFDPNVSMVFVSEEQMNFGAFTYVQPRANLVLEEALFEVELEYVGRRQSSSCSTGWHGVHVKEGEEVVTQAMEI